MDLAGGVGKEGGVYYESAVVREDSRRRQCGHRGEGYSGGNPGDGRPAYAHKNYLDGV